MTEPQAIAAALHARGVTTQRAQAALLGVAESHWCRHLRAPPDYRSPQGRTLGVWLVRLAAAGHRLRLECDHRGDWTAHEFGTSRGAPVT